MKNKDTNRTKKVLASNMLLASGSCSNREKAFLFEGGTQIPDHYGDFI